MDWFGYIRRRYIAWIGIIGLSLSILGALDPLIQLANIAHYIVSHWHEITSRCWNFALQIFDLKADARAVAFLNAGTSCFTLELTAMLAPQHVSSWKFAVLAIFNRFSIFAIFIAILLATYLRSEGTFDPIPNPFEKESWSDRDNWVVLSAWIFANMFLVGPAGNPYVLARRLLDVASICTIALIFNYASVFGPTIRSWITAF